MGNCCLRLKAKGNSFPDIHYQRPTANRYSYPYVSLCFAGETINHVNKLTFRQNQDMWLSMWLFEVIRLCRHNCATI